MTLYDRIKELRLELGMTQDDLAHAMGYKDRSMITKIEAGKVDISQKKVVEFARVLGTTPGYLMGWNPERWPILDNTIRYATDSIPVPPKPMHDETQADNTNSMKAKPAGNKSSVDKARLYQALSKLAKVDKEAAVILFEALIDEGVL